MASRTPQAALRTGPRSARAILLALAARLALLAAAAPPSGALEAGASQEQLSAVVGHAAAATVGRFSRGEWGLD